MLTNIKMAKQTWIWNKFYGGLWDYSNIINNEDLTKYWNESFSVDWRKNPEWVCLGQYLTAAEYSVSWDITAYLDLAEFGWSWIVAITKTGKVYLNWVLKNTFTWITGEIYDLSVLTISWTQYIYYFWPYWIHRSDMSLTTFIKDHRTFTNHWYSRTKILNYANEIYFSSWNYLNKINKLEVVSEWLCVLSEWYTITWLLLNQDYIRIYWKSTTNWILALWKRYSWVALPDYVVTYPWLPVIWVTGDSWVDYAIMWYNTDYSDLYLIQWLSKPQMLVSNPEWDISQRKFWDVINQRWWLIYLWWTINWKPCLFSYWKYYNWFPNSLQVEWLTWTITAIYPRSQDILFWNNVNWDTRSWIQYVWDRTWYHKYTDIWDIVSLCFNWWIKTVKNIETVEIYFNTDPTYTYNKFWWTILFYVRTKKSNSWTLVRTINTTTETKWFVRIARQEFWAIGSFNQIEYKIRLITWTTEWAFKISPLVTSIVTVYDDNLNK